MLQRILAELAHHQVPISLTMLSQSLQIEPSALEGMLTTLERKGRVVQVQAQDDDSPNATVCGTCRSCPIRAVCPPDQTWYRLPAE